MKTLYQKTVVIKSLKEYFSPYLSILTKPSGTKMFLLLLAMITMQFTTSINYLYKWFLSEICGLSLNSYYYLLTYTQIVLDEFFKITVKLAISLIPKELNGLPVFLIIDDTLQAKFGTHFECYKNYFDHTKRNKTNYLKGHCFVALMVSVPIKVGNEVKYLSIPVGFRLRGENENKLKIASKMIDTAMEILQEHRKVILLCDSWYPKGDVIETVKKHKNLELIANTRIDSSLFDLPPARTGKRGRPAEWGKALDIHTDFSFIRVGDYFIATRTVLTKLFGKTKEVYVTVTTPDLLSHKSYRVFISTVLPTALSQEFAGYEKKLSDSLVSQQLWLFPLFLYSFRWDIEVFFYEQKTFWSFGLYRLRGKAGIENFVNFFSICYACMQILPFKDTRFSAMINESPQTKKYAIGEAIRREIFLWGFISKSADTKDFTRIFDDMVSLCPSFESDQAV